MDVNCEGCAGCCVDWRAIAPTASDHERRGPREPLDDTYNLVPLTREDVACFLDVGLADALTPRLWKDESDAETESSDTAGSSEKVKSSAKVDGVELAAIDGKPVFFVGIRKPPKLVAPFEADPSWLPTCAFLDPQTLQCRIHDEDVYPQECAEYPGHNLKLGQRTECERVENAFGGERLLDDEPPDELSGLLLGPQAIGQKIFVYPDPEELAGVVRRLLADELTDGDRARFVAAAVAGRPGTTGTNRETYETVLDEVRETDSWVGRSIIEWEAMAKNEESDPSVATRVEDERGAPPTSGW
ncbi:YkgJ family cysteine cluster protein [Haladaptatus pallidirubidus]|uniref:YkgJ family cysteine cluster protein n=1 Tax=Haladaptatus pallidirubidus TaxID=1008152 RepID=A0AAV3UEZ2_9EURY|nr:YkgJ family cysteine cluster protein [Haladaptatus pallidirubidus]